MPKRECLTCRVLFTPEWGESRCPTHQKATRQRRDADRRTPEYMALAELIKENWIMCEWSGCTDRATEVDHVVPLADGGTAAHGVRPLCQYHNRSRRDRTESADGDQRSWLDWLDDDAA